MFVWVAVNVVGVHFGASSMRLCVCVRVCVCTSLTALPLKKCWCISEAVSEDKGTVFS